MMRKKRGYKRETPVELVRDYKLFAIACEGSKTEPSYFNVFTHLSRKIAVDIIEEIVSDEEIQTKLTNKSAPKWVLERAIRYIEKEGLSDEDELWFVMDVDKWDKKQLSEIASYCEKYPNWHIVLSNPCFEVWLYFHKKADIKKSVSKTCQDFKHEISKFDKGGYHPYKYIPLLPDAIKNAKIADIRSDHYFPGIKVTKVYQLGEAIMKVIGVNDFNTFVENTLPELIRLSIEKTKTSYKRKK
jgi:hypothetical protein